ncbi:MAG: family 78 glycoside hydrolase catalytic domain, partial [Clostridiales bacterium]|nr:family 78 glycoside hydrolase catalytic domain [Clostridiales bacterium]
MKGNFIGVSEQVNTFVLEKKFVLQKPDRALLKVTALGLYFAELNGVRVSDAYLTPGWTSYNKMLQVQEYDVSHLLKEGENVLTLTVNEGWYCGPLTWERKRDIYGKKPAVCADLILSDEVIVTDKSWAARESVIRESGIYDGEKVDLTARLKPLTAMEVPFDKTALTEQICEPVRGIERLQVKEIIHTPAGELVYDFGQNMAGVVEIRTLEDFNGTITLQFAEILVNGNFYTENLRSARATDTFTVKGAKTLCPEFTFHGFRYLRLTGAKLPKENITAIVRHT